MSFSSKTKNELARIKSEEKCCQKAELSALIRVSGIIQLVGIKKTNLTIMTENPAVARLMFTLFKKSFNILTEVMVKKNKTLKKTNSYIIKISDSNDILIELGIINTEEGLFFIDNSIPKKYLDKPCCRRAYLRGAFLGGGSLSDPEKGYHFEIVTHSEEFAMALIQLINTYEMNAKLITRKNNYVVYLKEGDQIVDLLNVIGAHNALLSFENTRIVKQMRNDINRLVNCETANLNKTVDAAVRQTANIQYIAEAVGLDYLPDNLRVLAELRLENEDLNLKELGQLLDPPVGKSGVNHRFKKIEKIAEEIREKRGSGQ